MTAWNSDYVLISSFCILTNHLAFSLETVLNGVSNYALLSLFILGKGVFLFGFHFNDVPFHLSYLTLLAIALSYEDIVSFRLLWVRLIWELLVPGILLGICFLRLRKNATEW